MRFSTKPAMSLSTMAETMPIDSTMATVAFAVSSLGLRAANDLDDRDQVRRVRPVHADHTARQLRDRRRASEMGMPEVFEAMMTSSPT